MYKSKIKVDKVRPSTAYTHMEDPDMDFRKIMKDVENFSYSHMTWEERKGIENGKVISLGGRAPKQQRLPLSVARPRMKKQKEREQKLLEERLILGQFGGKLGSGSRRAAEKQKRRDRGLKSSEGRFKNGVLDVRHLLNSKLSGNHDSGNHVPSRGKKEGSKMRQGKRSGSKKQH